jgi:DNA-binding NarL/FixJ family response regulator
VSDIKNPLSRFEITILRYVAQGLNCRAIGQLLQIKSRTIHYYFRKIKYKLEVQSMEEVMFIAGRDNLLGEYYPDDEV